jgi:hypothetical protein
MTEELPSVPEEELKRISQTILAAAWAPISKLDPMNELPASTVVEALAESAVAAEDAYNEARSRLKQTYDFFYIDTNSIVCTAYAAWLGHQDDIDNCAPESVAGGWLSAFASFVLICASLGTAADELEDSGEPGSFRGARFIKRLPKGFLDDD